MPYAVCMYRVVGKTYIGKKQHRFLFPIYVRAPHTHTHIYVDITARINGGATWGWGIALEGLVVFYANASGKLYPYGSRTIPSADIHIYQYIRRCLCKTYQVLYIFCTIIAWLCLSETVYVFNRFKRKKQTKNAYLYIIMRIYIYIYTISDISSTIEKPDFSIVQLFAKFVNQSCKIVIIF